MQLSSVITKVLFGEYNVPAFGEYNVPAIL